MSANHVDQNFTVSLPKAELHAHLSGSVSVERLRQIWMQKQAHGLCLDLQDPAIAIRPDGEFHDVISFFPLFDNYIYNLCDDLESVRLLTTSVLEDFEKDGVAHLELRTTPRENAASGLTRQDYVTGVLEAIREFSQSVRHEGRYQRMNTSLILSIDRRMTSAQADEVVELAIKYRHRERGEMVQRSSDNHLGYVVGVDLCGNPARGNVTEFTNAFRRAKAEGLGITVHFAEIPQSSSDEELETILAWQPDRLGHVIHVQPRLAKIIEERQLGLELCLSCNILAKMTTGGFAQHHFGRWWKTGCPVALSTDDVGVFGSSLSNEYLIAAQHFVLSRQELIDLCKSAASCTFSGRQRLFSTIDQFEKGKIEP